MNRESTNAVAGPSTIRPQSHPQNLTITPTSDTPPLFLPPPPAPPSAPVHLTSTQDLLSRFLLLPAYDKYVRPFAAPTETGLDQIPQSPVTPRSAEKGKGKEVVANSPLVAQTPMADGQDADDDEGGGKGEKKKKNSYKHLIKGVPGKHSLKKDDYLTTIMQVPPRQRIQITPFDMKTQREAFSVSLEGLKGWNVNALVLESAQAREDRKKRKELKRLAKAQAIAASGSHQLHIQAPLPTSGSSLPPTSTSTPHSASTATPKPIIPRPGSRPTIPPVQVPLGNVGTATPSATVTPSSAHPVTSNALSASYQHPPPSAGLVQGGDRRGKKRERDDGIIVATGGGSANDGSVSMNGNVGGPGAGAVNGNLGIVNGGLNMTTSVNTNMPKAIINAKAGVAGIKPRPLKKQRMDIQGQARDMTVAVQQQPTPQGV